VKKWPNDHKNGPSNPPTNFIQLKFCPNHCAIFSLNKNRPMLKIFCPIGKMFPNLVTLTFDERLTFVERVPTMRPASEQCLPGPNPTIASYNASAVKIYNAASSLVILLLF
jgi:hypothetical protein